MIKEILIVLAIATLISMVWLWVGGMDYMNDNHPDYKGEDFLNEEDKNEIS